MTLSSRAKRNLLLAFWQYDRCSFTARIVIVCTDGFGADPAQDVNDTMLFRCQQEVQAAFSHHTPHFLKIEFIRWDSDLITILPRALGTEVLFPR